MRSPFSAARSLSNTRLLREVEGLAQDDRNREVEFLVHIAELDRRRLYRVEGYPSLFRFLFEGLRMSDHAAYNRIGAARAARKHPVILEHIKRGEIHITGVRLLAPHLTEGNCLELLERAKHKTRRQIEVLVADLAPRPDAPELVRRLPERSAPSSQGSSLAPSAAGESEESVAGAMAAATPPVVAPQPPQPAPGAALREHETGRSEPLGRGRFKVQFTADRELIEVLEEVQSLMRHQVPDGNLPAVFGRALRLLRDDLKRVKFGQTGRPSRRTRARRKGKRSRHVPNSVRRKVAQRDAESCAYVSPSGKRCGSKDFLQYDHLDAWAKHGEHRTGRIRLLCREHNQLAAEVEFGREHMEQFARRDAPGQTSANSFRNE